MFIRNGLFVSCVILTVYANRKMNDYFGFTASQLVSEGRLSNNEIKTMQEWLKTNNYTNVIDEQVAQFLLACDRNLDVTKNTMREYYQQRKDSDDIFTNRNMDDPSLKTLAEIGRFNIIPKRTKNGSAVVLFQLASSDHSKFHTATSMKLVTMAMDVVINEYPPKDVIIIFDVKKMGFMHLFSINLGVVSRYLKYLEDALPVKLKSMHVLNMMGPVDTLLSWIKPLMKEKVRNMLITHPRSYDLTEFYKIVDKECLPSDYGGLQPSVYELHQKTIEKLDSMKDYFIDEEYQRNNMTNNAKSVNKNILLAVALVGLLITIF